MATVELLQVGIVVYVSSTVNQERVVSLFVHDLLCLVSAFSLMFRSRTGVISLKCQINSIISELKF